MAGVAESPLARRALAYSESLVDLPALLAEAPAVLRVVVPLGAHEGRRRPLRERLIAERLG
jgi:hypothetical protein